MMGRKEAENFEIIKTPLSRTGYPTLDDCTYLNQASLGLMGQPAVSAMTDFIEQVARHGNRYMSDDDEVAFFTNLRNRAAQLFGTSADQVAIVASASEILGQLPFLIQPTSGSKVLTVRSDFPALTRPWLRLAQDGAVDLRFVDDDPAVDLTDIIIDSLDQQTSVVAVSHVQYATGTLVDIPRLRAATRSVNAALIVDVTQSAGAMKMDVNGWGADALVSSGYKWLGGHGGAALAVLSPELITQTPPLPGWMGAPDPFDFDATQLLMSDDARRFTQSTMSYASLISLTVGIEQLMDVGIDEIERHSVSLAEILIEGLAPLGWQPFRALTDPAASSHIISLAQAQVAGSSVLENNLIELALNTLRERNIICSSRGGRIRVSLAPYNNEQDVDTLIDALTIVL